MDCPICGKEYIASEIESHVNKCLFLNEDDGVKSTSRITKSSSGLDAELGHNNKRTATGSTRGLMQLGKRKSSEPMGNNKKAKYQMVRQSSNEQRVENDGILTADSQLQQQNKVIYIPNVINVV